MQYFYTLIRTTFLLSLMVSNISALTPSECNQTGGGCVCITFPGEETICSRSQNTVFARKEDRNPMEISQGLR